MIPMYLCLASTKIKVKKTTGESFEMKIGTTHGDAQSPLIFVIYLAKANQKTKRCMA